MATRPKRRCREITDNRIDFYVQGSQYLERVDNDFINKISEISYLNRRTVHSSSRNDSLIGFKTHHHTATSSTKRRRVVIDSDDEWSESESEFEEDVELNYPDLQITPFEKFNARTTSIAQFRALAPDDVVVAKYDFPCLATFAYRHDKLKQMWQTTAQAVEDLLERKQSVFPQTGLVWDICCGVGSLLANIKHHLPQLKIAGNDIAIDGAVGDARCIPAEALSKVDAVVTNPPFALELLIPIMKRLQTVWFENNCRFDIFILIGANRVPEILNQDWEWHRYAKILPPRRYKYAQVVSSVVDGLEYNNPSFSSCWIHITN